jgi:hypothetical protein
LVGRKKSLILLYQSNLSNLSKVFKEFIEMGSMMLPHRKDCYTDCPARCRRTAERLVLKSMDAVATLD